MRRGSGKRCLVVQFPQPRAGRLLSEQHGHERPFIDVRVGQGVAADEHQAGNEQSHPKGEQAVRTRTSEVLVTEPEGPVW